MNRRRLAAVVIAAALTGGLGSAHVASADDLGDDLDLRSTRERYWACVAVDTIHVGTCIRNPLPDPNDWGKPPV